MDVKAKKITDPKDVNKNNAYGTAWIFYEELGGTPPLIRWSKVTPKDRWQFVKDRLNATAVKQFVDRVMLKPKTSDSSDSADESEEDLELE